jgi:3-oxoacyl-[acyl-carrier protein] reductase
MAERGTVLDMDPDGLGAHLPRQPVRRVLRHARRAPGMIARRPGDMPQRRVDRPAQRRATLSAYAGSKAAMLRLTEALVAEVRRHDVRVTALVPSTVNTELSASMGLPIGADDRMMQPEDVADLVVATLRLPRRVFVRDVALLTTNPQ